MATRAELKAIREMTAQHDGACISAAVTSAVQNMTDARESVKDWSTVQARAAMYLSEGMESCRCLFANMTAEARIEYLTCLDDDALAQTCMGGRWNDFTGEFVQATSEEYDAVMAYRHNRDGEWATAEAAVYVAGDPDTYVGIVASDTEVQPRYSLQVNGKFLTGDSPAAVGSRYVNRYGLAEAVAWVLFDNGLMPLDNVGIVQAVYDARLTGDAITAQLKDKDVTFTVVTEAN